MARSEANRRVQRKKGCMNIIVDGKSGQGSFKKRKSTLKNKASELAKLCDVMVCMVCLGPDGEVDTWPENKTELRNRINKYQIIGASGKQKAKQTYNLVGFVENKKKKMEQKLNQGKSTETFKQKIGNLFSKWDEKLEQFSPEALMGLCNSLDSKLQNLRERIQLMQIKENEKEIQVFNGDSNAITNPINYLNMMNDCCQPLLPLMFNNELCYNQQAFGDAIWLREYYTVAGGSSSSSGDCNKNNSNFWWDGNVDYGRQRNFDYEGLNYNHNIPVGDINNNFSLGFGHANTGLRIQENFDSMGESRGSVVLGPS